MDKAESTAARQRRFAAENNRIADRLEPDYPEVAAGYRRAAREHEACARSEATLYLIRCGENRNP